MSADPGRPLVVVGSINADVWLDVARLPHVGETISADPESGTVATGGKARDRSPTRLHSEGSAD